MVIHLPIDIKSLYCNIKNDNATGHTATVATPLKQYGGVNQDLIKILDIPENVNFTSRANMISQILSKSRAQAKINNVFVFDKISVNGIEISNVPSFCMYIREETEKGYIHCGRQKVHYPLTFQYDDQDVEINNRIVMKAISAKLHNYAFIVEAFEYDTESQVLNFDVIIVGENGIPYSKVFINRRGVGSKFTSVFNEDAESYDMEIIALRDSLGYDNVGPVNYAEIMTKNRITAESIVKEWLLSKNAEYLRKLTDEYPYALYDFEYKVDGIKYYVIVRYTATKVKYFNLSINKSQFCNDFSNNVSICLITNVCANPKMQIYSTEQMNLMSKRINSICYIDEEN